MLNIIYCLKHTTQPETRNTTGVTPHNGWHHKIGDTPDKSIPYNELSSLKMFIL